MLSKIILSERLKASKTHDLKINDFKIADVIREIKLMSIHESYNIKAMTINKSFHCFKIQESIENMNKISEIMNNNVSNGYSLGETFIMLILVGGFVISTTILKDETIKNIESIEVPIKTTRPNYLEWLIEIGII